MSTKHLFYVLVSSHPVEANRIFKKYSGQYDSTQYSIPESPLINIRNHIYQFTHL